MGCCGSKESISDHKTGLDDTSIDSSTKDDPIQREAELYERRKQNNFRDTGLDRHIQACLEQKNKLRKVQVPDQQQGRKQKLSNRTNMAHQCHSHSSTYGVVRNDKMPVVITQNDIKDARNNLRKVVR